MRNSSRALVAGCDERLPEDRYRVRFAGNTLTPREPVGSYLLFRAAEFVTAEIGLQVEHPEGRAVALPPYISQCRGRSGTGKRNSQVPSPTPPALGEGTCKSSIRSNSMSPEADGASGISRSST